MKNISVIICLFLIQNVFSQSVALDSTFGVGGKVVTSISPNNDYISSVALQSDGKIVVSGVTFLMTISGLDLYNFVLIRYNQDGSLDDSFGVNGKVILNAPNAPLTFRKSYLLILDDQKIVVAGGGSVLKFNSDGTLDSSFGTNGVAQASAEITGLVQQNDGKFLLGYKTSDLGVGRMNADGSIDTSFGVNGTTAVNIGMDVYNNNPLASYDYTESLQLQSDGKIIVAGTTTYYNSATVENLGMVRFNVDGSLDTTFGTNGIVVQNFASFDHGFLIKVLPNDELLIAGAIIYYPLSLQTYRYGLAKYNENGVLDTSFGNNGIAINPLINREFIYGRIELVNGKILVSGFKSIEQNNQFVVNFHLTSLNENGSVNTSFNSQGFVTTSFDSSYSLPNDFIVQPDGKIIQCGYIGSTNSDFALCRFDVDNLSTNRLITTQFSVAPNPFKNQIHIKANSLVNTEIELYDVFGRKLYAHSFQNQDNFVIPIDEDFSNGTYFLKITSDQKTKTHKLIKQ